MYPHVLGLNTSFFNITPWTEINNFKVNWIWYDKSSTSFPWWQTILRQKIKHSISIRIKSSQGTTKSAAFHSFILCHVDEGIEECMHFKSCRTLLVLVVKPCYQPSFVIFSLEFSQDKGDMQWLSFGQCLLVFPVKYNTVFNFVTGDIGAAFCLFGIQVA